MKKLLYMYAQCTKAPVSCKPGQWEINKLYYLIETLSMNTNYICCCSKISDINVPPIWHKQTASHTPPFFTNDR